MRGTALARRLSPTSDVPEKAARLRADEATETDRREAYQKAAPAVSQGLYLVPKVIE